MTSPMLLRPVAVLLLLVWAAFADDNGKALTPPMGWRSWNLYGRNVNQSLIEGVMDAMVKKTRMVDGKPTSLCDLGYCDVGLDDNWQKCGSYGTEGLHYHDDAGNPIVNLNRFPDFKKMTAHAHSLGLTSGWYGNNCICKDHNISDKKFYEGDVKALRKYGFDSLKLDGCGAQTDMQLWNDLIKGDGGKAITVENCHWGRINPFKPNATWCPWNFFRTSADVRARYSSVIGNLATTVQYAKAGLSRPGCWAYPDMLEVGCQHGPGGAGDPGLNVAETRTHFGAWAIVSSPLTLSHDVNNDTIMDAVWPVISNVDAIEVNQAWAGHSGSPFKTSSKMVELDSTNWAAVEKDMAPRDVAGLGPTVTGAFMYLHKPMMAGGKKTAVLLMNNDVAATDLEVNFADIPGVTCATCHVRDVWSRKDLGTFTGSFTAKGVASHDSSFLIITP